MRDPVEIAREIAPCRCEPCWTDRDMHSPDCLWDNCGEEIVDALAAARREAMEWAVRAARAAVREWSDNYGGDLGAGPAAVKAIRALIDPPPTGGEVDAVPCVCGHSFAAHQGHTHLVGQEPPLHCSQGCGCLRFLAKWRPVPTQSPAASPPPEPKRCPRCGLIPGYPYPPWEQKDCDHQPPTGGEVKP